MVIYSGEDTKLMMSMEKTDPKRSKVDNELNHLSKLLFLIMISAACVLIVIKGFDNGWVIQFFRYVLLLCSIIPLSMKVNQDISKLFFANRINRDNEMKDTLSRNSMIAEDLGRIEYFLTDKTGTLTKNEMIMKRISLGETIVEASDIDKMVQLGLSCSTDEKEFQLEIEGEDEEKKFFRMVGVLLTCHAVFPKKDNYGFRELESTSPDELSFVEFCEKIGFLLVQRTDHIVSF
jgi:phospholipid-translocating ATPase